MTVGTTPFPVGGAAHHAVGPGETLQRRGVRYGGGPIATDDRYDEKGVPKKEHYEQELTRLQGVIERITHRLDSRTRTR